MKDGNLISNGTKKQTNGFIKLSKLIAIEMKKWKYDRKIANYKVVLTIEDEDGNRYDVSDTLDEYYYDILDEHITDLEPEGIHDEDKEE